MRRFIEQVKKDKLNEYSAESAYFIILSIIPFTLVFISLIQYINIDKSALIFFANEIIPPSFQEMALNIIEEIYSKTISTLSISIIFTIWSASKGIFSIMKGINNIYNVQIENYWHRKIKAFILTILFIILLAITSFIMIIWNYIGDLLNTFLNQNSIKFMRQLINLFRKIGLPIIIFFITLVFYKLILNYKCSYKNQILGAAFVTIFWYILSYGFSLYITINRGFSLIYGSLTTIILFMIWTYSLIYVIFIGAEINSYFKN